MHSSVAQYNPEPQVVGHTIPAIASSDMYNDSVTNKGIDKNLQTDNFIFSLFFKKSQSDFVTPA
jgi:hypothetical protein